MAVCSTSGALARTNQIETPSVTSLMSRVTIDLRIQQM